MTSSIAIPAHFSKGIRALAVLCLLAVLVNSPIAMALKSDADQPATINADDVELDFKTGERIYTGNVFVRQGSMELTCDKLVATFKDDQLAVATAYGNADKLAVFKQRPEGKNTDVIGKAVTMILDQIEQLVTLSENASLNQGTDTVTGQKILYDLELEKMRVKGSQTTIQKPTGSTNSTQKTDANSTTASDGSTQQGNAVTESTAAVPADAGDSGSTDNATAGSATEETTMEESTTAEVTTTPTTESDVEQNIAESTVQSNEMIVPNDPVLSRGTTGRPRIILQPRSKRNPLN